MPAGGGTSQTAVNRHAGARTQVAELVTAAGALATLLLLAPYIALMPKAALAAVVIVYSFDLIKPSEFVEIRGVRTAEFRWALVAFAGVVLLGTLQGIVVAVIVSLLSLARQAYYPPLYALGRMRDTTAFRPVSAEHPDDQQWPGLLMMRMEGRLFFANAERVADFLWAKVEQARPRVLLLDCRAVFDVEYTALKVLAEVEDKFRRAGCELWLAGLNPAVFEVVERSRLGATLGHSRMFLNMQAAVEKFQQRGES
jgi:MFS superfamily sulfate permease-like transporter